MYKSLSYINFQKFIEVPNRGPEVGTSVLQRHGEGDFTGFKKRHVIKSSI